MNRRSAMNGKIQERSTHTPAHHEMPAIRYDVLTLDLCAGSTGTFASAAPSVVGLRALPRPSTLVRRRRRRRRVLLSSTTRIRRSHSHSSPRPPTARLPENTVSARPHYTLQLEARPPERQADVKRRRQPSSFVRSFVSRKGEGISRRGLRA